MKPSLVLSVSLSRYSPSKFWRHYAFELATGHLRQFPTSLRISHNGRLHVAKCTSIRTYLVTTKTLNPESRLPLQTPKVQTFVSSFYQLPIDAVVSFLTRHQISFKEALSNPEKIIIQYCPFCHDIKEKKTNMWKLYIDKKNGYFYCFRCGARGTWFDFQRRFHNFAITNWEGKPINVGIERTPSSSLSFTTSEHQSEEMHTSPMLSEEAPSWTKLSTEVNEELPNPNEVLPDTNRILSNMDKASSEQSDEEFPNLNDLSVSRDFGQQQYHSTATVTTTSLPTTTSSFSKLPRNKHSTQYHVKYREETAGREIAFADATKLNTYLANVTKYPEIKQYLNTERGLKDDVIEKYRVGGTIARFYDEEEKTWKDQFCVVFPWYGPLDYTHPEKGDGILRYKYRALKKKYLQRLEPVGGGWGMFGWHLITPRLATCTDSSSTRPLDRRQQHHAETTESGALPLPPRSRGRMRRVTSVEELVSDPKTIVVTEGEFDAMAVYQATGFPAVSLPCGANCMPPEIIAMFEPFERIYLWLDDDVVGQEAALKFAMKLGRERCYLVHTKMGDAQGPKDANDALRAGKDLKAILSAAQIIPHKQILHFTELRDEVYRELAHPAQVAGCQSQWLPKLNQLLRGLRKGELTILTGTTGIGKTTLAAQLSLDYCMQGVHTLWGSFELNNVRLIKKLLNQFAMKNLEDSLDEFNEWADKFSQLPFYFMRFHGETDVDTVVDAMDYAVYVYDVEHIVLDNLQFMLQPSGKGFERFDQLDTAVSKFRKFATTRNVHITLIIHPRKEDDNQPLTINSVFGTAKATQEADNVIIMQRGKYYRFIEVVKNRFSGDLGTIPYHYDTQSSHYIELSPQEIQRLARTSHTKSSNTKFEA